MSDYVVPCILSERGHMCVTGEMYHAPGSESFKRCINQSDQKLGMVIEMILMSLPIRPRYRLGRLADPLERAELEQAIDALAFSRAREVRAVLGKMTYAQITADAWTPDANSLERLNMINLATIVNRAMGLGEPFDAIEKMVTAVSYYSIVSKEQPENMLFNIDHNNTDARVHATNYTNTKYKDRTPPSGIPCSAAEYATNPEDDIRLTSDASGDVVTVIGEELIAEFTAGVIEVYKTVLGVGWHGPRFDAEHSIDTIIPLLATDYALAQQVGYLPSNLEFIPQHLEDGVITLAVRGMDKYLAKRTGGLSSATRQIMRRVLRVAHQYQAAVPKPGTKPTTNYVVKISP